MRLHCGGQSRRAIQCTMLQLRGTLTLGDLIRFQYFHVLRRTWPGLILVLLVGVALLALVLEAPNPGLVKAIPLGTLFFIWIVLLAITPYWNARRQFSRQRYLRDPISLVFSKDEVQSNGPSVSSAWKWSVIRTIYETKSQFLLYYAPNQALLLPKRFFANDAELDDWRSIVRSAMSPKNIQESAMGRWF